MAKATKDQKRQQKVQERRKNRERHEHRVAQREAEKLRKANAKLMEAVEAAVARGIKEYSMPDLVVRDMLTSIIQDHLFMPIAEEPGQPPAAKSPAGIPAGPRPAAQPKKVFDKSAWQVPKPTGPAVSAPSSDPVSPASPAPLGGEGNTGQANNGSPVLEGVAGFDRGAFGGGSAAVNRNGH